MRKEMYIPPETLMARDPNKSWQLSWDENPDGPTARIIVTLSTSWDTASLPRAGSLYRAMLITQPPIKVVTMVANCCSPDGYGYGYPPGHFLRLTNGPPTPDPSLPQITSETGITLGDLLDAAETVVEAHRLCPQAPFTALNDGRYVRVAARFEGTVRVRPDDPIVLENQWPSPPQPVMCSRHGVACRANGLDPKDEEMKRYTEAKVRGT
jgi:hypothetical protein